MTGTQDVPRTAKERAPRYECNGSFSKAMARECRVLYDAVKSKDVIEAIYNEFWIMLTW